MEASGDLSTLEATQLPLPSISSTASRTDTLSYSTHAATADTPMQDPTAKCLGSVNWTPVHVRRGETPGSTSWSISMQP